MPQDKFEDLLITLQSTCAKQAIAREHIDFPGASALNDWNTIPFGIPSICKDKLMAFVTKADSAQKIIQQAQRQIESTCVNVTKLVLFYICISKDEWSKTWDSHGQDFKNRTNMLGIDVEIRFMGDLNVKICEYCGQRKASTYKTIHDTWLMQTKKVPACRQCALKPQDYMT